MLVKGDYSLKQNIFQWKYLNCLSQGVINFSDDRLHDSSQYLVTWIYGSSNAYDFDQLFLSIINRSDDLIIYPQLLVKAGRSLFLWFWINTKGPEISVGCCSLVDFMKC